MKAEEIKEIIKTELISVQDMQNVFGVDLTKCLIEPVKQNYLLKDNRTKSELWTVLEESPDGYRIFFDDQVQMFGLGMISQDGQLSNIGYHGTFLQTLNGM